MNKRDQFIGECIDYTHDGLGVVKHDNTTIFVKNLLLHETAKIEIIKVLKSYCVGRVVELQTPSSERIEPKCDCFKQCGGCSLMHMSDQEQQSFKTNRVKETFLKIAHQDLRVNDCLMDQDPYHYRNKVQVPFGKQDGHIVSGFYKARTNDIINNDYCLIQNEFSNKVIKRVKELFEKYHIQPYDKLTKTGNIKHVLTKTSYHKNEAMVVFISYKKKIPHIHEIIDTLTHEYPEIRTIIQNINSRHDNVILGEEEKVLYGEGYIEDTLLGNTYKISMKSFYQINPRQVEVLYSKAIEYAKFKPTDVVIDAYCGIGTISLTLAKHVKKVYGVEVVPQAIVDAKENAERNHITNAEFVCDDAGHFMTEFVERNEKVDCVMVDPPRKGCSTEFLERLTTLSPERIVYISCNVATQARDLTYLVEKGYKPMDVQPVDMFPHTPHIENILLLSK